MLSPFSSFLCSRNSFTHPCVCFLLFVHCLHHRLGMESVSLLSSSLSAALCFAGCAQASPAIHYTEGSLSCSRHCCLELFDHPWCSFLQQVRPTWCAVCCVVLVPNSCVGSLMSLFELLSAWCVSRPCASLASCAWAVLPNLLHVVLFSGAASLWASHVCLHGAVELFLPRLKLVQLTLLSGPPFVLNGIFATSPLDPGLFPLGSVWLSGMHAALCSPQRPLCRLGGFDSVICRCLLASNGPSAPCCSSLYFRSWRISWSYCALPQLLIFLESSFHSVLPCSLRSVFCDSSARVRDWVWGLLYLSSACPVLVCV